MSSANVIPSAPEYAETLYPTLSNQCRRFPSQENLRSSNRIDE